MTTISPRFVPQQETRWEEPETAVTPRGWYFVAGRETAAGWYLDYGPDYRIHREHNEWCLPEQPCVRCEPGTIFAVAAAADPGGVNWVRWFETVAEARAWIERQAR